MGALVPPVDGGSEGAGLSVAVGLLVGAGLVVGLGLGLVVGVELAVGVEVFGGVPVPPLPALAGWLAGAVVVARPVLPDPVLPDPVPGLVVASRLWPCTASAPIAPLGRVSPRSRVTAAGFCAPPAGV